MLIGATAKAAAIADLPEEMRKSGMTAETPCQLHSTELKPAKLSTCSTISYPLLLPLQ